MLPNSLRIRCVYFAFLFGPPRIVEREEASGLHGKVCDALTCDDLSFRYSSSSSSEEPDSKGFSIALERKEGRGVFAVSVDNENVNVPMRLLLEYTWPPTLEHAKEMFDMTAAAAFSALNGDWQRVLAEVRLRAQCDTREHDGLGFLKGTVLGQCSDWIAGLGTPLSFCGVKVQVAATPPQGDDQLHGAKRELAVEVLREEPGGVYFELMSQWPWVASMPRAPGSPVDPPRVRQIDRKPSEYVEDAYVYLGARVASLAAAKEGQ